MYVFRIICYSIRKHELIRESVSLLNTYVHQTVFKCKTKIFMYLNTTITSWKFETKIIYNTYVCHFTLLTIRSLLVYTILYLFYVRMLMFEKDLEVVEI